MKTDKEKIMELIKKLISGVERDSEHHMQLKSPLWFLAQKEILLYLLEKINENVN